MPRSHRTCRQNPAIRLSPRYGIGSGLSLIPPNTAQQRLYCLHTSHLALHSQCDRFATFGHRLHTLQG